MRYWTPYLILHVCETCEWMYFKKGSLSCLRTPWNQVFVALADLLFVFSLCLDLFQPPTLWEDVSSPHAVVPEDASCHLVYLIITLPALLHNAALSPQCHSKCLVGLFSETILKLCAKALQTVPPLFSLQPCVPEPEKDSSTAAQSKGKQTRPPFSCLPPAPSHRFYDIFAHYRVKYSKTITTAWYVWQKTAE